MSVEPETCASELSISDATEMLVLQSTKRIEKTGSASIHRAHGDCISKSGHDLEDTCKANVTPF